MRNLAPVVLFVYKRPAIAQRTIDALRTNDLAAQSDLIVHSDGPRHPDDESPVREVRRLLGGITGFRSVQVVEHEENFGLARSIITGVTEALNRFSKIIVLEDDLVTSPHFLQYMNDALDRYEHTEEVISVHGYVYPARAPLPGTFFLKGADCWGWGTWRRGWKLFNPDAASLLTQLQERGLTSAFDFDGAYPYTRMLRRQAAGKIDSWAICWYASAYLADKLTLYPGRSLVENAGGTGDATHTWSLPRQWQTGVSASPVRVDPIPVREHAAAREAIKAFFRSSRPSLTERIAVSLKRALS